MASYEFECELVGYALGYLALPPGLYKHIEGCELIATFPTMRQAMEAMELLAMEAQGHA